MPVTDISGKTSIFAENSTDLNNEQKHQRDLERLKELRPIDDDFMRCLFKDNKQLAEFVLQIILDKPDLVINSFQTQKDMKQLGSARSICLMYMARTVPAESMIWKFRGLIRGRIHIGQDITPVYLIQKISGQDRNLRSFRKHMLSLLQREISLVPGNQFTQLRG